MVFFIDLGCNCSVAPPGYEPGYVYNKGGGGGGGPATNDDHYDLSEFLLIKIIPSCKL